MRLGSRQARESVRRDRRRVLIAGAVICTCAVVSTLTRRSRSAEYQIVWSGSVLIAFAAGAALAGPRYGWRRMLALAGVAAGLSIAGHVAGF